MYLSALADVDLGDSWADILFEPAEARDANRGADVEVTSEMLPVLYGDRARPFMNFDPVYFEFPDPNVARSRDTRRPGSTSPPGG